MADPILAQTSSTLSVTFNTLLLKSLIYSGGAGCSLVLSRVSAVNGLEQPGSIKSVRCLDVTLVSAIQNLISQFIASRDLVGELVSLSITGKVNNSTIGGSLRLLLTSGLTVINDVYAEAQKDSDFSALLTSFLTALATYNNSAKVI